MSMKSKGVAFNLDDPDQKDLYDWAMSRTNFSAYIKRLIQTDREQKRRVIPMVKGNGISITIGDKQNVKG